MKHFIRQYMLFSVCLLAAVVALVLDLAGLDKLAHILLIVAASAASLPLLYSMIQDLRHGTYGIDILAITAIVSSLLLQQYWAGIIIVLMLTGGETLENYAERRSKRELNSLLERAPAIAHIVRGSKISDVAASAVRAGDRILIKPGEIMPVDAVVLEGDSEFDESSLTGESLPHLRQAGDRLLSGSLNISGLITARAIHSAANSQYQQIVKLVRAASHSRAPFVRLADRYSIPFTLLAFAIAGTVWALTGQAIRFLEVIVVATPCPLLLAAPIAIISGMSRASKAGIIIRTGSALERLAAVKTIAFDKTGTLTSGKLTVDRVQTFHGFDAADVLAQAAAVEVGSSHVLAQAIVQAATNTAFKARQVRETAGLGLQATINGKTVLVGRKQLIDQHNVTLPAKFRATSVKQTACYVAIGGELAGIILLSDSVRLEAAATLNSLRALGLKQFEMITGDSKVVAADIASRLGIDQVIADALPADKVLAIEKIAGRPVAFVGDGVNDAPVLTAADVGIALGASGSTAASESADIVIMVDDLGRVASAASIAKRTFRIARQSILIGIGLSVLLMAVFATGKFPPIAGAVIQEVVDVVVIFNALRAHST